MKAVGVSGPDFEPRLFDVDEPIPAHDGVVVDVMAASVNEFDRAAVRGQFDGQEERLGPVLLGRDFVGRVTAVGEDVNYIDIGMYVAGVLAPNTSERGTFTDKVAVPAQSLAPAPDGTDLAHTAGVGLAGISGLDAVDALGIKGLETVVIHGPVSGAGGFALQLAKARGAVVAALTVPEQAALARELGADAVIAMDASPRNAVHSMRSLLGGVDVAIHVAGDLAVTAEIVCPGGKFTSISDGTAAVRHVHSEFVPTVVTPGGHKLADLLFKVAARRLRSHVDATASFDQVGDAVSSRNESERIVVIR
jgi:NADPH:quinone reductase-like Zn-dependent oxidoreductase